MRMDTITNASQVLHGVGVAAWGGVQSIMKILITKVNLTDQVGSIPKTAWAATRRLHLPGTELWIATTYEEK